MTYRIVGDSDTMVRVRHVLTQVCTTDVPLLITGEDGVGRKHVARYLHQASRRSDGPLITCDFDSLPAEEHEPRLFGSRNQAGALVSAHLGTLLIWEPGALRRPLQAALIGVLSSGALPPRQGSRPVDVRVVSVTRRNLEHAVSLGEFEDELLSYLSIAQLSLSPLRDRGYDILQLADYFAARVAELRGAAPPRLSAAACRAMLAYGWPGNVRELKEVCEAAYEPGRTVVDVRHLPEWARHGQQAAASAPPTSGGLPTLDDVERRYIHEVLAAVGGNKSRAARVLGVDRRTLYRILRKLDEGDHGSPSSPTE